MMCYDCINIYGIGRGRESAKATSALHDILDRLINPEFQSYGLLYFTYTLKSKWQCALPSPRPTRSVANRLYQWKQHRFVQDDTFSQ